MPDVRLLAQFALEQDEQREREPEDDDSEQPGHRDDVCHHAHHHVHQRPKLEVGAEEVEQPQEGEQDDQRLQRHEPAGRPPRQLACRQLAATRAAHGLEQPMARQRDVRWRARAAQLGAVHGRLQAAVHVERVVKREWVVVDHIHEDRREVARPEEDVDGALQQDVARVEQRVDVAQVAAQPDVAQLPPFGVGKDEDHHRGPAP